MSIELYQGDCLIEMSKIADGSVDMILCDLPYGTTACKWDSVIPLDALWQEYKRIIKPRGAVVLFAAQPFTTDLIVSNRAGFKYALVWYKSRAADFVNAKNKPMRNHEDILVFSDGATANGSTRKMSYYPQGVKPTNRIESRKTSKFGSIAGNRPSHTLQYTRLAQNYPKSVLTFLSEPKPIHPTQKPVPLLAYLIRTYTNEGDTVLDNCMGSGSALVACIEEKRNGIGIELDPDYFKIATERINSELNKPRTMKMDLTA